MDDQTMRKLEELYLVIQMAGTHTTCHWIQRSRYSSLDYDPADDNAYSLFSVQEVLKEQLT